MKRYFSVTFTGILILLIQDSDELCGQIRPRDCQDVQENGFTESGIYRIFPGNMIEGFEVYCDMDTDYGGWVVIQNRFNGTEDFDLSWDDYQCGFGDLNGEFWLGNQQIHTITKQGWYELLVELQDWDNATKNASYKVFSVGDASTKYAISVGCYSGDAGNSLAIHDGKPFSTKDKDATLNNCATLYAGGWWFAECHHSNLNGPYLRGEHRNIYAKSVIWFHWKGYHYSLKKSQMKIRKK